MKIRYIISILLILTVTGAAFLFYSERDRKPVQAEPDLTKRTGTDTHPERSVTARSRFTWINGAQQSYRFSISSDVSLDLTGSSEPQQISQRITGILNMRVFDTEDGVIRTGFQLSPATYSVNGETNQGVQDSLSLPFLVVFGEKGRPQFFEFADASEETEQMILEEAMRVFQVVLPDKDNPSWDVAEEHATGTYQAHYQSHKDGSIQKQKTRYSELNIPFGGSGSPDIPQAQIKKSAMNIRISPDKTWIANAALQERMIIMVGTNMLTDTTMKAELEVIDSPADPDVALFRDGSWDDILHAYSGKQRLPKGDDVTAGKSNGSSLENSKDLLTGYFEKLNSGANNRIALLNDLEQLLRKYPGLAYEVIEYLRNPVNKSDTESTLIHALERAGTPEAQDALVMLMNDSSYTYGNRLRAIIALGGVETATDEAITALLSVGRSRGQDGYDIDLANTAVLSAGSIGSTLSNSDPGRSGWIRDELIASLEGAEDENEAGMALKAMGNIGDPALTETITRYINHDAPFVRASAAQTLGRIRAEETLAILTDQLGVENNALVRSAIATAMENIGNPSYKSLDTVNSMVLKEPDSKTRYQMVRYIGENVDMYPEGVNNLKRLASTDRSKQIRRYVSSVFFKMRDQ